MILQVDVDAARGTTRLSNPSYTSQNSSLLANQAKSSSNACKICDICEATFDCEDDYKYHVAQHKCPYCPYSAKPAVLNRHISRHNGNTFVCQMCYYLALSIDELRLHSNSHIPEKCYYCPHCNFTTPFKTTLDNHIRRHTGEKPFRCPHCDFACAQRASISRHIKKHYKNNG